MHQHQKEERRNDILAGARNLLARKPYDEITLNEVADELKLVKGTLYRYFPTREALFLELFDEELHLWFFAASAIAKESESMSAWISAIAANLESRKTLLTLIGLVHVILEHNLEGGRIARLKESTLAKIKELAGDLNRRFALPEDRGLLFLMEAYTVILGLSQLAFPPPSVEAIIRSNPNFSVFKPLFAPTLTAMLMKLLGS